MLSPLTTAFPVMALNLSSLCHSLYSHLSLSLSLSLSNPDRLIRLDSLTSQTQEGLSWNHRCLHLFFLFALVFGLVSKFALTQSNKIGFCFVVDCVTGFVFVVGFKIGMWYTITLQLYWVAWQIPCWYRHLGLYQSCVQWYEYFKYDILNWIREFISCFQLGELGLKRYNDFLRKWKKFY